MSNQFRSDSPSSGALKGAGTGAAIGFALWLFSHWRGSLQIGPFQFSGDWVQSLGIPLPAWLLSVGAGSAIGAIIGAAVEVRGRGRTALMRETAARMGLEYAREISAADVLGGADFLRDVFSSSNCRSVRLDHHFHGTYDGLPMDIFDLTVVSHHSKGKHYHRRTVCVVSAENLPEFRLTPRKAYHWLDSFLGFSERMLFAPENLDSPLDRDLVRRFEESWNLEATDFAKKPKTDVTEHARYEQRVRVFFTAGLMNSLRSLQGWSVAARRGRLIVWGERGFSSADDRQPLAAAALKLRSIFIHARESSTGDEVPAPSRETYEAYTRRGIAAAGGIFLGAILGFFGGGIGFASYTFSRDLQIPDAIEMALVVCVPFAGLVLGGFVGGMIGSCIGHVVKFTPRTPAARSEGPNGWVVVGLITGFMLGGVVGAAFDMLVATIVGPGRVPTQLILPAFFAFPAVGLIVGAIAGGRFQAYRARRRGDLRTAHSDQRIDTTESEKHSLVAAESELDSAPTERCE
jgi:hypothetical protein